MTIDDFATTDPTVLTLRTALTRIQAPRWQSRWQVSWRRWFR